MENDLAEAQAAVRETLAQLRTVLQERDSYQRQLDAIGDAIVPALVHRIEPRLSRHPVTVIMAAGALIANIGEAIDCKFADGDDLLEAVKKLVRERDDARAEAASSLAMARIADEKHGWKCAEIDMLRGVGCMEDGDGPCGVCRKCAYRRGVEAMREACAREASVCANHRGEELADILGALPIPEEP